MVQGALAGEDYAGAMWLESSFTVAETAYWLNLLIDTQIPISANSSQRVRGIISTDGDRNLVDALDYILSKAWADDEGKDRIGTVLLQAEQIFASRQAAKDDARPGGYLALGGHGGILGTVGPPVTFWFEPTTRHTWQSAVNFSQLPVSVPGVQGSGGKVETVEVQKMKLGDPDSSGRRKPINIKNASYKLEADMVIKALGFDPEDIPKLFNSEKLLVSKWGTIKIDLKTMETNLRGVFAAGDIVRGSSLVVWAIRDGRDVAVQIEKYLKPKVGKCCRKDCK